MYADVPGSARGGCEGLGGSGLSQGGAKAAAVTGRRESRQSKVGTGAEQTLLFAALPSMVLKGKGGWSWVLAACKI